MSPRSGSSSPGRFRHPQPGRPAPRPWDHLRSGSLQPPGGLIRGYAGADEEKKKIISEIFRRLAVDVKDELVKAARMRRAGETILATGQAIADLRK